PRIRSLRIRGLTALYLRPGAGTGLPSPSRYFLPPPLRFRPHGMGARASSATAVSRRRQIERPRLTPMLDESGARVIPLVAPAGYGKTTLAHEWLEGKRAAWYRGSPASADVAALAVGLATAAAEIVPNAGERMRQRLRASDRPEDDAPILAEMLAEDVAEWPDDAWLVIDDYQFATESPASEEFLRLLSEVPKVSIVLTSRRRP